MTRPVVVKPGEGESFGKGAALSRVIATSEATEGRFTIIDTTIPPGFPGPPPHFHRQLTDSFYILEGTLTVQMGEEFVDLVEGTYLCVPPNHVHSFSNRSDAPTRFLNINSPGGWENYVRQIARLMNDGPPTATEWREVMSRFDLVPVDQAVGEEDGSEN